MADMMQESMQELNFQGLTSYVQFDKTGSNKLNIRIEQQRGEVLSFVCTYYKRLFWQVLNNIYLHIKVLSELLLDIIHTNKTAYSG